MLIPSYSPLVGGGMVQLRGLLKRIDRDRYAPFVLTRRVGETVGADRVDATPVVRLTAPPRPAMLFFAAVSYLWKHRREYDVIHVHSLDALAMAGASIKHLIPQKTLALRIPRFGEGSSFDRLSRTRRGRAQLRFLLGKVDAVIPPSRETTDMLEAWGLSRDKIVRVPNGVDTAQFLPASEDEKRVLKRSFGIAENTFVAVIVARLNAQSKVMLALEAWKRVCHRHPDSALIVVGDGPEGPRLSAYAETELEGRSIIFTGGTSREEVKRLLRTADVYVSYSWSVETSNAMLEAMSSGLPVVAAHTPAVAQTVCHSDTGFLFDPKHPMDGANHITRLAQNPELVKSMSTEARRRVETQHAFEKTARRLEQVYQKGPLGKNDRLSIRAPARPVLPPSSRLEAKAYGPGAPRSS
jgi:glycosyltransferase involved in cell wall biosynthesis